MPLILGSHSPRRKEILQFFSVPFTQVVSSFPEEEVPFLGDPVAYVTELALAKGSTLAKQHPGDAILTADTVVFYQGNVYNKPKDREEAVRFLTELSGQWHSVFTAVALSFQQEQQALVEETKLLFHTLTSQQIAHYLDHVNFLDKAGGFAVQQGGALIVKRIEGCYYNVLGLPLTPLCNLLARIGIDLWERLSIL
ncbi:MAG: septum formation protein Maf [Chlamydiae bacterium]|nr:septum formation protein Maf [Chlamydiota bacterium]